MRRCTALQLAVCVLFCPLPKHESRLFVSFEIPTRQNHHHRAPTQIPLFLSFPSAHPHRQKVQTRRDEKSAHPCFWVTLFCFRNGLAACLRCPFPFLTYSSSLHIHTGASDIRSKWSQLGKPSLSSLSSPVRSQSVSRLVVSHKPKLYPSSLPPIHHQPTIQPPQTGPNLRRPAGPRAVARPRLLPIPLSNPPRLPRLPRPPPKSRPPSDPAC